MKEPYGVVPVTSVEVASWSPGVAGEDIPPTAVHLLYRVPDIDVTFVLRLKSAEATDSLISALTEHRNHVWGENS